MTTLTIVLVILTLILTHVAVYYIGRVDELINQIEKELNKLI